MRCMNIRAITSSRLNVMLVWQDSPNYDNVFSVTHTESKRLD